MSFDDDLKLALKLQEEEYRRNAGSKESFLDVGNERLLLGLNEDNEYADPKTSVIDPSLELSDPTPDIHQMFVGFDKRFFGGKLGSVEVMWSPRMTQCAGICRYRSASGACTVHLSLPLLKLRPRKDLIETLLHEMIHAYLFVTHNNRDRDGHGAEFHSHMNRINREAGTNITVYHSFHDEVNVYKTHWWRCNGVCQKQKPFYGMVRRSMNRAPGPNDLWWASHQRTCGGTFIKIREPENYKAKGKQKVTAKTGTSVKPIQDFFLPSSSGTKEIQTGNKKSHVQTNGNIPPGSSRSVADVIPFSGKGFVIGSQGNLPVSEKPWLKRLDANVKKRSGPSSSSGNLNRFLKRMDDSSTSTVQNGHESKNSLTNKSVPSTSSHEDSCSETKKKRTENSENDSVISYVACPVCQSSIQDTCINEHLDTCLNAHEKRFRYADCMMCGSGLDEPSEEPTICKVCRIFVAAEEGSDISAVCEDRIIHCALCKKEMRSGDVERHLENCDALCFKNL